MTCFSRRHIILSVNRNHLRLVSGTGVRRNPIQLNYPAFSTRDPTTMILSPRKIRRRLELLLLVTAMADIRSSTSAFTPPIRQGHVSTCPLITSRLAESPNDDDNNEPPSNNTENNNTPSALLDTSLSRFTAPRIDDPYLPLSDALVAQIIAPSLQISWLSLNRAPSPSWLQPIFDKSQLWGNGAGSLLAPTLIHGAALATCWLVGALAARAYEREAISVNPVTKGYGTVVARLIQAGSFATGVLILGTQLDVYLHNGYIQWGDSPETDFRLQVALVEGINDVFFEALTLGFWRLYLAYQSSKRL